MNAAFYFDPMCPWTWMTSRWLVDVAARRDVTVTWRSFSLALLNEGQELPPELLAAVPDMPARLALGLRMLRVVESLRQAARNEDIGRLYTEFGERVHVQDQPVGPEVLDEAGAAAGVQDHLAASDDHAWDRLLRTSLADALDRAGPDIGSPVLVIEDGARGAFGPIVSPPPRGEDADRLWDAIVALHALPEFLELKRGRTGPPSIPGRG